ncbi:MAG: N-acetylmuramic acid 6-phosphate etherase [Mycoplasmataceae bacterium]|nr:N-acetylmuramic acid 6-phosphate etherase [Mycoplasmataceae bacterium]
MKSSELKQIDTEKRNKKTINIDQATSLGIVKLINNEDKKVAKAIKTQQQKIAKGIDLIVKAIRNDGRLIYIGAGTSGRLGVLDASEMPPTYNVDSKLVIGLIAGGQIALTSAVENAEDSKEQAIIDLKKIKFNEKDVLVGISASGRTPYVVSALEYANEVNNNKTISLSTVRKSAIGAIATISIDVPIGAEVITGSTRMKSGSAQKMVLNMLSTGTMIKLGKVYQNLMIDVKPANEKLKSRAVSIVSEICQLNESESIILLEKNEYNVRKAIEATKK